MDNNRPRYEQVNVAHYTRDDEQEWFNDYVNEDNNINFDQHERDLLRHIIYDEGAQEYRWSDDERPPRVRFDLNLVPLYRPQENDNVASKKKKRKSTRSKTKKRKYHKKRKSRKHKKKSKKHKKKSKKRRK